MNRPRKTAYRLHKTSKKAHFTLLAGKVRIPPSPLLYKWHGYSHLHAKEPNSVFLDAIVMKRLFFALCLVFAGGCPRSEATAWPPPPGHTQVPIRPGEARDGEPVAGPEVTSTNGLVRGVSQPTMTVYLPTGMNTGAAAVVFPGEGCTVLAIGLKGTEVCDWLTSQGITTVLLKYRVQGPGFYRRPAPFPKSGPYPKSPMALEDAQRAVGPVRFHAAEWHIDPHKIGVLGFSAGGHLLAAMRTHFDKRLYPPVYAADKVSCRPDFCGCSLSGHLWNWTYSSNPKMELIPDIATRISRETPPTFLLQVENDNVDNVNQSLVYYIALKNAGVPVQMHLYAQGGHGFGLRRTKLTITGWPSWLRRG